MLWPEKVNKRRRRLRFFLTPLYILLFLPLICGVHLFCPCLCVKCYNSSLWYFQGFIELMFFRVKFKNGKWLSISNSLLKYEYNTIFQVFQRLKFTKAAPTHTLKEYQN